MWLYFRTKMPHAVDVCHFFKYKISQSVIRKSADSRHDINLWGFGWFIITVLSMQSRVKMWNSKIFSIWKMWKVGASILAFCYSNIYGKFISLFSYVILKISNTFKITLMLINEKNKRIKQKILYPQHVIGTIHAFAILYIKLNWIRTFFWQLRFYCNSMRPTHSSYFNNFFRLENRIVRQDSNSIFNI
jgi:hypothetical protein